MTESILSASVSRSKPRPRSAAPQPHRLSDDEDASSRPLPLHKSPTSLLSKRGLRIGRTRVGKGLFATKRIVDGSCIGEIQGQIITDNDYVSRYAFDLNNGQQLEPDAPFRFVNHSCEPNCAFECFAFPVAAQKSALVATANEACPATTHRKLLLFAICDIDIGQELTIDYNWPAIFAIPCGCRAVGCRGWIVTASELPKLLDRLSNHSDH